MPYTAGKLQNGTSLSVFTKNIFSIEFTMKFLWSKTHHPNVSLVVVVVVDLKVI